jgi:hypothetical protein
LKGTLVGLLARWRANQRSMVPVRRIFFCNSMTP